MAKRYNVLRKEYPDGTIQERIYEMPIQFDKPASDFEYTGLQVERGELENLSRAKQVIYDLSRSNVWSWFVTLTYSPEFVDRSDYDACTLLLRNWTQSLRRTYQCSWLLVPEFHEDMTCYHFHGLVYGDLPVVRAYYPPGHRLDGLPIGYCGKNGHVYEVYNISNWNYGFSTATPIHDQRRVSSYMMKYMNKEIFAVVPKGRKRYWASRSLLRPKEKRLYLSPQEIQAAVPARYEKKYCDLSGNQIILRET